MSTCTELLTTIFSPASCHFIRLISQTPSICALHFTWQTRLHTHRATSFVSYTALIFKLFDTLSSVWCSELSSGIYCRVKWLSTDDSEVRTASIIPDVWSGGGGRSAFIRSPIMKHDEPGSSVSIVSGYGLDDRAIEVRFPAETKGFFPLASVSRAALRPTQPPVQWVPAVLFRG
jgi:hypothetical protein